MLNVFVIIPFYNLPHRERFINLLDALLKSEITAVVLVNDGAGSVYDGILAPFLGNPKLTVLQNAVNSGKGAAIKAALNYVYCQHREHAGAVVMHANGEHRSEDALAIARELERSPHCLIQGVSRSVENGGWNTFFASLFRLFTGAAIQDVTTGMRAIPSSFIPLCLKIRSNYYEFDMDLILLSKYNKILIRHVPIVTVSEAALPSRFNPVLDSMKIAFVFFRFLLVSLLAALIDFIVFVIMYGMCSHVVLSIAVSRASAMVVNYRLIKTRVFYSSENNYQVLSKYLILALSLAGISCAAIMVLVQGFSVNIFVAKVTVEASLFLLNFLIQRDFIFVSENRYEKTNWDLYYEKPFVSARMTRKIMEQCILVNIKKHVKDGGRGVKILELGGANSCFLEGIRQEIDPGEYHVADNNEIGLEKLRKRVDGADNIYLYQADIFDLDMRSRMDLVFSAGLIEHFSPEGTMLAVKAHFDAVKPGGVVLLTFPTSTWLYHVTRFWAVVLGLWIFNDERPLKGEEAVRMVDQCGEILHREIVWSVFLTQMIIVARKR